MKRSNIPITFSDGKAFSLDDSVPYLLGYQITHVDTGRILPTTSRTDVYTKAAAIRKMNTIAGLYTSMDDIFDIWEYHLSPVYEGDVKQYTLIEDKDDNLF